MLRSPIQRAPDGSPTEDLLDGSSDEIHGGFGNDVILGHWGYITVAPQRTS